MRQGPLPPIFIGFVSVCWLAQRGTDHPAAPAQPPYQPHVTLLSPEPARTALALRVGELRAERPKRQGRF